MPCLLVRPPRKKARVQPPWEIHRERRRELAEERAKTETAEEKKRRMARIELAMAIEPKAGKGTEVFRWLEDVNTGKRVRHWVGKKKKNKTLRKYAPTQRFYCSVTDQWDVCTSYDSDAPKPYDSDDDSHPGWSGPEDNDNDDSRNGRPPASVGSRCVESQYNYYDESQFPVDFDDPPLLPPDFQCR